MNEQLSSEEAIPQHFSEIIHLPEERIDLSQAALLVAKEQYPDLDIPHYLAKLDELGERALTRVGRVVGPRQIVEGLSHYLFHEEGFHGNVEDYYSPTNSFLNDVLDHRAGIPITLSLITIEIGRRAGLPFYGVGFPGHFMVKYSQDNEEVILDPFHKGQIISENECAERLKRTFGSRLPFHKKLLRASTKKEILTRMLTNLKMIYLSRKNCEMALRMTNHIVSLNPNSTQEIKERGILYHQLDCVQQAIEDFKTYLVQEPQAVDREAIEQYIRELSKNIPSLH
ncbi:MAG: tetratricopeptide repeat protein [Deltaproteobacteria bacterium]|nr:tetratricopeptide repeat protein [Deltaproteobacteria bacterium]